MNDGEYHAKDRSSRSTQRRAESAESKLNLGQLSQRATSPVKIQLQKQQEQGKTKINSKQRIDSQTNGKDMIQ
jgi:hypothetical protein